MAYWHPTSARLVRQYVKTNNGEREYGVIKAISENGTLLVLVPRMLQTGFNSREVKVPISVDVRTVSWGR